MKKTLITLLTCCLVISLIFFIRATDLQMVLNLIGKIGYKFTWLLLITFVAYLFGTISWQFTLGKHFHSVSTGRLFLIRHLGETVGMFNPTSVIGGDALKGMLLQDRNIPRKTVIWSLLFSRAIMVLSQISLFISTAITLIILNPAIYSAAIDQKQSAIYPLILSNWKMFRSRCSGVLKEVPLLLKENKRMLLLSGLFAILHWVFGAFEFYFILKFLGLKVSLLEALVVDLGVVVFKSAGAFIPAQIGVEEYGNKFMLMVIGISSAQIWITASILRRARQLVWIGIGLGIYLVLFRKTKFAAQT